ncbi:MAG: hypothetical protein IJT88_04725 [Kiritimatiellae bacterium]|nr:hypothetical protein [Kiritimatiellia bacterium]
MSFRSSGIRLPRPSHVARRKSPPSPFLVPAVPAPGANRGWAGHIGGLKRIRILDVCDRGDATRPGVDERFGLSTGFVKKLLSQRKRLGIIDNLYARTGRKPILVEAQRERM